MNPFMPSGLFFFNSLDRSISSKRGVWLVLLLPWFTDIPLFNANSVDPDQTPRLIWVYAVCQCPFYGKLDLNGLKSLP